MSLGDPVKPVEDLKDSKLSEEGDIVVARRLQRGSEELESMDMST